MDGRTDGLTDIVTYIVVYMRLKTLLLVLVMMMEIIRVNVEDYTSKLSCRTAKKIIKITARPPLAFAFQS